MKSYIITGGIPLKGDVPISGRKNSALKLIAATLLTSEETTLYNVPEISDIHKMIEILGSLGVKTKKMKVGVYKFKADNLDKTDIPKDLARKLAGSKVLVGPLLARVGKVIYPEYSGGCKIGRKRPMNRHFEAFKTLGAKVSCVDDEWYVSGRPRGGVISFKISTVMGTENALLSSVLAEGETKIINAAQEPQIEDLISMLKNMGADILRDKKNPRTIYVKGVRELKGTEYGVGSDEIEAGTFAIAAAVTGGDVVLKSSSPKNLKPFLDKLAEVGVNFEICNKSLRVWRERDKRLKPLRLETAPYPGFLTDWQPPFAVLLTQADGVSFIHETIWINRLAYTYYLNRMGAKIKRMKPSETGFKTIISDDDYNLEKEGEPKTVARIKGPTPLKGSQVKITDLRAGATLVIAALAAEGISKVFGVEYVERGYESFAEKLRGLGAKIR